MRTILIIREVEYAVRILDELHKESPLSAAVLSKRQDIPSPFIYRVLKKLEAAEILEIRRGSKGGYLLRKSCEELTLFDVIDAFENTFLVIECMKPGYDCTHNSDDANCCMHREFARIQARLRQEFKSKSLAELLGDD